MATTKNVPVVPVEDYRIPSDQYIHEIDREYQRQQSRIETRRAELLRDLKSLRQNVDNAIARLEAGPTTGLDTWWIGAADQCRRHTLALEATYEAVAGLNWIATRRAPETEELLKRAVALAEAGAPIGDNLPGQEN